jgi:hypothetical protein
MTNGRRTTWVALRIDLPDQSHEHCCIPFNPAITCSLATDLIFAASVDLLADEAARWWSLRSRETVSQGRDTVAILGPPPSVPSGRDWDLARFLRQSPRKSKTFPLAAGNRICVGLRGGPGRTQTDHQPVMGLKGSDQRPQCEDCPENWLEGLPSHRYGTACASAVTVASCGPVPSMTAANVRGGMKASGVRRRMCLSTLPSRFAIPAND